MRGGGGIGAGYYWRTAEERGLPALRSAGTPWTLAAYAIEGSSNKYCMRSKKMMQHNPEVLHAFLAHLSDSLATYVCYQIESGAQARSTSRSKRRAGQGSTPVALRCTRALERACGGICCVVPAQCQNSRHHSA